MTLPAPAPALGLLRLAGPSDILRIGVVATCGFRYSSLFDWERPYHESYPQDTLLSYRQGFSEVIQDEYSIVVVAEDTFDPEEAKKSNAVIPDDDISPKPEPGCRVVVGAACWKLQPNSPRVGQFQNNNGSYPDLPRNFNRDSVFSHAEKFAEAVEAADHRYFHGLMTMEMVVVHPAYWRRGHGTDLVKWGLQLSTTDKIGQGVIAAEMGAPLYQKLGYEHIDDVDIPGDEIVRDGVHVSVLKYTPKTNPAIRQQ